MNLQHLFLKDAYFCEMGYMFYHFNITEILNFYFLYNLISVFQRFLADFF